MATWTSVVLQNVFSSPTRIFRQLSPRFETFTVTCQELDVQRCSPADHEHHPVELCPRCPTVFLQDRGVRDRRCRFRGFHHQLLQSWHRCASVTPAHCTPVSPRVLSTREVAWLSQQPSVHADPRRLRHALWSSSSCLSAASSLAACCLLWASSACRSTFCLVKPSNAVVNCCCIVLVASTAIVVQRCQERGAFQTFQLVQFANRISSTTTTNESLRRTTIFAGDTS